MSLPCWLHTFGSNTIEIMGSGTIRPLLPRRINDVLGSKQSVTVFDDTREKTKDNVDVVATINTTFTDSTTSHKSSETTPIPFISVVKTDPYPDQGIDKFLTRNYRIADITWGTASAAKALLSTIEFPSAMTVFPNIVDKLSNFKYFRSGIKVGVRINSTGFLGGAIMVSYTPFYKEANANVVQRGNDIYNAGSGPHFVMSAASGDSLEFVIPWTAPKPFMLVSEMEPSSNFGGMIGIMKIWVLAKLDSVSVATPEPTISVFAQFENPHVAGLEPTGGIASSVKRRKGMVGQSESFKKSSGNTTTGVAEDKSNGVAGLATSFTSVVNAVSSAVSAIKPIVEMGFLSKPNSVQPMQKIYNAADPNFLNLHGLDVGSVLGADATVSLPVVSDARWPGPAVHQINQLAQTPSLLTLFAFDNTATVDEQLSMVVVHPLCCPVNTAGGETVISPTHLAWWSSSFKMWRGSIKYRFAFFCSKFISCRVRISWYPDSSVIGSIVDYSGDVISKVVDINGDTVVDILVPYLSENYWSYTTVPNAGIGQFLPSGVAAAELYNSVLVVNLVSLVQMPDVTSGGAVSCAVWCAAGEDYQLYAYVPMFSTSLESAGARLKKKNKSEKSTSTSKLIGQSATRADFLKPFKGLVDVSMSTESGLVCSEKMDTVNNMCKRYGLLSLIPADGIWYSSTGVLLPQESTLRPEWYNLMIPFLCWAGSVNVKASYAFPINTFTEAGVGETNYRNLGAGLVMPNGAETVYSTSNSASNTFSTFTLPWYQTGSWLETAPSFEVDPSATWNAEVIGMELIAFSSTSIAMGDDLSLGILMSPPTVYVEAAIDKDKKIKKTKVKG